MFEGSTIISDCWKSYDCLSQHDFEHLRVNHKYNFVDPETLAHTQNIENLWWQIKRQLPETYTKHDQLYLHLSEYMWQKSKHHKCDLYMEFLRDAAKYVRTSLVVCYVLKFDNSVVMTNYFFTDLLTTKNGPGTWFHRVT